MVNQKSILYRDAKQLAITLNIAPPIYRYATISSLQQFIEQNSRPNRQDLPFLDEVRNYIRGVKRLRLRNQTPDQFAAQVRNLLTSNNYYYTIKNDAGDIIRLRRGGLIVTSR